MKLNREEFETLWNIGNSWQTDPVRASDGTPDSVKKYMKIFLKLDEIGLIKIEIRDGQIYGAHETKEGEEVMDQKVYDSWIPEC